MKQESLILEKGRLKDGTEYHVRQLDQSWIDKIHALHERVQASIPPGEIFMGKKTPQDFKDHLQKGGIIVGAVGDDGQLLGKAMMTAPPSNATPDELGLVSLVPSVPAGDFVVLQASSVDPRQQGKGLGQILIRARLSLADARGIRHAFSEVNARNRNSMAALLHNGLEVINAGHGIDAYQTLKFLHLHGKIEKTLATTFNAAGHPPTGTHAVALDDLDKINELLLAGYKGVAYSRAHDTLHLEKDDEARKLIGTFRAVATGTTARPAVPVDTVKPTFKKHALT